MACSLTGCFQSVVGDWELTDYDEDALKESIEDDMGDNYTVEELKFDFSFSLDDALEGEGETDQEADIVYSYDGTNYDIAVEVSMDGDVEAKESGAGYKIDFVFSGTSRVRIPDLDVDESNELEDQEMELACVLTVGTLTCEDGDDVELIFTKQ